MSGLYGIGNYGYGNYSAPTDQPLTLVASASEFRATSVLRSQTYMRAFSARAEYVGTVGALRSQSVLRGASGRVEFATTLGRPSVQTVLHPAGARSEYAGWVVLQAGGQTSIMLVPGRVEYVTGGRIAQWARVASTPARIEYAGVTGALRSRTVFRPLPAADAFLGVVSALRSQTVLRGALGRIEYQSTLRVKATFKTPLNPAPFELAGVVRISYAWSDLTAPGRYPAPNWIDVAQAPADPWQTVPDLPPN